MICLMFRWPLAGSFLLSGSELSFNFRSYSLWCITINMHQTCCTLFSVEKRCITCSTEWKYSKGIRPICSLPALDYSCFTPANTGFNDQSQQHPSNPVLCWILSSASCHHLTASHHKHQSQHPLACAGRGRCEKQKQRWCSRCSLAPSRRQVFVVTLICNQASSHIRSRPFWKGRRAPFYLRLHGVSPEKWILSWPNK